MNKRLLIMAIVLIAALLVVSCTQSLSTPPPAALYVDVNVVPTVTATPQEKSVPGATATTEAGQTQFLDEVSPAVAEIQVSAYTPPMNAVPLISHNETIGFFFVLNEEGPKEISSPYQSTAMFTLGNGKVGDLTVSSDGTEGNVVTLLCNKEDGCTTQVSDYISGHVGVTIIFAGKENPADTVLSAIKNMFNASNCGGSGCNTIHSYQDGQVETFTQEPSTVNLNIPWEEIITQTAVIGEPPADAKVVKIGKVVVGHQYVISGSNLQVSVPEGNGGTILCFPNGGNADGQEAGKGETLSFSGTPSDGATPEDLNLTIDVTGENVVVLMIYLDELSSFESISCN